VTAIDKYCPATSSLFAEDAILKEIVALLRDFLQKLAAQTATPSILKGTRHHRKCPNRAAIIILSDNIVS
jgi:hypothetical protein